MAKNNSPFTLGATGSVRGITYSKAQGTEYFKNKASEVRNPRSEKQQQQRARLTLCTQTAQNIALFLNVAYKQRAYPKTNYNEFTAQNLQADKMDVVATATEIGYTANWLPAILSVRPNPNQKGDGSATFTGGVCNVEIANLTPSRTYTLYYIAQDSGGVVGKVYATSLGANPSGILFDAVNISLLGVGDFSAVYCSMVDSVTGAVSNFTFPA